MGVFREKSFDLPSTLRAHPTACPKQYRSPSEPPNLDPVIFENKKEKLALSFEKSATNLFINHTNTANLDLQEIY